MRRVTLKPIFHAHLSPQKVLMVMEELIDVLVKVISG
jgi:hypothetical protein